MVARIWLVHLFTLVTGMLLAWLPFAVAADAILAVDTGIADVEVPTAVLAYAVGEAGYWRVIAVAFPLLVGGVIVGIRSSFPQFVAWMCGD
jgi:hypothetical protein